MSGNRRSDDVEMNSKYNSCTSSTSSASSEDEPPTYKEVVQSKKQSKCQPRGEIALNFSERVTHNCLKASFIFPHFKYAH